MDKQELLKVLDMSEDEQWTWLGENYYSATERPDTYYSDTLADLAFRLRDEARKTKDTWWAYWDACKEVIDYNWERKWADKQKINNVPMSEYMAIWIVLSDAIDQIIAALIALEKK